MATKPKMKAKGNPAKKMIAVEKVPDGAKRGIKITEMKDRKKKGKK